MTYPVPYLTADNLSRDDELSAIKDALNAVHDELLRATLKFGPFHSAHEGYGVIAEEFDEFWDEVKANNRTAQRTEVTQLAAMAVRYLVDIR